MVDPVTYFKNRQSWNTAVLKCYQAPDRQKVHCFDHTTREFWKKAYASSSLPHIRWRLCVERVHWLVGSHINTVAGYATNMLCHHVIIQWASSSGKGSFHFESLHHCKICHAAKWAPWDEKCFSSGNRIFASTSGEILFCGQLVGKVKIKATRGHLTKLPACRWCSQRAH